MKTIVVANNKGGVGKTTVASQIAYHLGRSGRSVIAVDLDGQRNLTAALAGQRVIGTALKLIEDGAAPVITTTAGEIAIFEGDREMPVGADDAALRSAYSAISDLKGADFCVIDTPPAFSAVVYGALLSADYMLAPIELKKFSLDGVEEVLRAFIQAQDINKDIAFLGLLPSRFDAVKKVERDKLIEVVTAYSNLIIPHAIRNRTGYEEAEALGMPVYEVQSHSGKEAAAEFGAFFDWLMETVEPEAAR